MYAAFARSAWPVEEDEEEDEDEEDEEEEVREGSKSWSHQDSPAIIVKHEIY
jgi:hypothetical protein